MGFRGKADWLFMIARTFERMGKLQCDMLKGYVALHNVQEKEFAA